MSLSPTPPRQRRRRTGFRPLLEQLEPRYPLTAPAGHPWLSLPVEAEPNDTLNAAQDLGPVAGPGTAAVTGEVGGVDVDWYRFALASPAAVALDARVPQGQMPPAVLLGLYNDDPDDFLDPYDPLGHRLLARDDGADGGGDLHVERHLGPGTYYLAVSGSGNDAFHPFLAGSGYPAGTGGYELRVSATEIDPGAGPAVLASDPAPGQVLGRSPFVLRADLSAALDPGTIIPGETVRLTFNPDGAFGNDNDQDLFLGGVNFSPTANELQLTPAAPLAPGSYRLFLAGDGSGGGLTLAGPDGTPLGQDPFHPSGRDVTISFQVSGVEEGPADRAGDDTPATAHDLGDLTGAGRVRVAGAVGDDPTDPVPFNPADVDLYHFRLSGPERHALSAEVLAGRIGSPLDPGVSLFRADADGRLRLVAANDNTLNDLPAANGTIPLFADSLLTAGLTAGDYYLAVSGGRNTPDPLLGRSPGVDGVFDPNASHSGAAGGMWGDYLLSLQLAPDDTAPRVLATTPGEGAVLDGPPTQLTVWFSEPINLRPLAFRAFQQTGESQVQAVSVEKADGTRYYPRLTSFDPEAGRATFLMLDRLPAGNYRLRLSGPLGLTDPADNPLAGNDPAGDYQVHFKVRGTGVGGPSGKGRNQDDDLNYRDLGVLFPHELQAGLTVGLAPTPGAAHYYYFRVLQGQEYTLQVTDDRGRVVKEDLRLTDAEGNVVPASPQGNGEGLKAVLAPGTYVLSGHWSPREAYRLRIALVGNQENLPPLTAGPAPVLLVRPVGRPAGPPVAAAPQVMGPAPALPETVRPPRVINPPALVFALPAASLEHLGAAGHPEPGPADKPGSPVEIPAGQLLALGPGPVGHAVPPDGDRQTTLPDENGGAVGGAGVGRAPGKANRSLVQPDAGAAGGEAAAPPRLKEGKALRQETVSNASPSGQTSDPPSGEEAPDRLEEEAGGQPPDGMDQGNGPRQSAPPVVPPVTFVAAGPAEPAAAEPDDRDVPGKAGWRGFRVVVAGILVGGTFAVVNLVKRKRLAPPANFTGNVQAEAKGRTGRTCGAR